MMVRKCPKCLKQDAARYCPVCGTEMFFPERFEGKDVKTKTAVSNGTNGSKLLLIKLAHTAIWCVFAAAILYVLYAGIFDKVNIMVWICIVSVFIEGIVLMIFKGKCPFTIMGYNYAENPQVGFDIFLPAWLAKNNKLIFSTIFFIGFGLVLFRVFIK